VQADAAAPVRCLPRIELWQSACMTLYAKILRRQRPISLFFRTPQRYLVPVTVSIIFSRRRRMPPVDTAHARRTMVRLFTLPTRSSRAPQSFQAGRQV